MPTIDLFIKSYSKDFWLLYYALDSLKKNVTGYNNLILVIPEHEKELFDTRQLPDRTLIHYVPERSPGWLWQQYLKITAHNYCFADFICFSDSDNIFTKKINIADSLKGGKPEILHTDWSEVGQAICWKEPTEKIMGEDVPWEGMRRLCQIHYRETLVKLNEWRPNLEETIMTMNRFSEFNLMSSFAYKFCKDKYIFTDTKNWIYEDPIATQIWSHCNKTGSDTHLKEYIRFLETILMYYGIKVPDRNG